MKTRSAIKTMAVAIVSVLVAICSCGQTFTVLHTFTNSLDGSFPGGLVLAGSALYGITTDGGASNAGTIYSVNTDGTDFRVLHQFDYTATNGANQYLQQIPSLLTLCSNTLYGVTPLGDGMGTVFAIDTDGTDFTVLYTFNSWTNGRGPTGALALSGNTLYATTEYGGASFEQGNSGAGSGTVFEVNTDGTGFQVLHSFAPLLNGSPGTATNADGYFPGGGVVLSGTTLYGMAEYGGATGSGVIFSLDTNGSNFKVLYNFSSVENGPNGWFTNSDGYRVTMPLLVVGNRLYGTAIQGGIYGYGTVFALNTDGTGFITLHAFDSADGANPETLLTLESNTLYGTTFEGGENNNGTIFSINTNGSDFTVLYECFNYTNAEYPADDLILCSNTIYGITQFSDVNNGTVFSMQLLAGPTVSIQPQIQTVTVGNPTTFVATTYGSLPLSFQWLFSGMNILNATNSTFTLSNAFPVNAGLYSVVVTNLYGSVTSAPAMLTVSPLALTAPQSAASGQFQFSFGTATGVNYTVQYSTSLSQADWIPLLTFDGYGGPITIIDPNAAGCGQRFYRIVLSAL